MENVVNEDQQQIDHQDEKQVLFFTYDIEYKDS
jgi:hypothetical protein